MASSGTFSGKAVNSNVSCGVGGWADHSIRGSWIKGTNSTTFTASLYRANGSSGFQYACSRGLWFKVLGSGGQVVGEAKFLMGSSNGAVFTFPNGSRMNLWAGSNSCCGYGGNCPAVPTSTNGSGNPNTINLTIYYSGPFTLQTCWDGWCGSQAYGCKQIEYGGNGYIDSYNKTPSNPNNSFSSIACKGVILNGSVSDKGIPEDNFLMRMEYGINNFDSATDWTNLPSKSWLVEDLLSGKTYTYRLHAKNNIGDSYSPTRTFTTNGVGPKIDKFEVKNPKPFQLTFNVEGIVWDPDVCGSGTKNAIITWTYKMDNVDYSFNKTFTNYGNNILYDTGIDMDKVPDDEIVNYKLTLFNDFSSITRTGSIKCQKSFDLFVIGPSTNYKAVEAEMKVSPLPGSQPLKEVRRILSI